MEGGWSVLANSSTHIRYYRKMRGLNQSELATQSGLDETMISKIEKGTRGVSFAEAIRFAEILQVPLDQLAGLPVDTCPSAEIQHVARQCAERSQEAIAALTAVVKDLEKIHR